MNFKTYLSMITGDGALVKLDVVDPMTEDRRVALAGEYGFKDDGFNGALFIYICNVLDRSNMALANIKRKELIAKTAKELVRYFINVVVLENHKATLESYATAAMTLQEWTDETIAPSFEVLDKLSKDMERVYKVWHDNVLPE